MPGSIERQSKIPKWEKYDVDGTVFRMPVEEGYVYRYSTVGSRPCMVFVPSEPRCSGPPVTVELQQIGDPARQVPMLCSECEIWKHPGMNARVTVHCVCPEHHSNFDTDLLIA